MSIPRHVPSFDRTTARLGYVNELMPMFFRAEPTNTGHHGLEKTIQKLLHILFQVDRSIEHINLSLPIGDLVRLEPHYNKINTENVHYQYICQFS